MNENQFVSQYQNTDVVMESKQVLYNGFFKIHQYSFRHALFAGGQSELVHREMLERGDAVAVLPYDPVKQKVVLIEQIRIGALPSKQSPWLLEVVAGMIDKNESREQVALREAEEEAGLQITQLIPMTSYLSSPGGTTERLYLYLGVIDSTGVGGIYGLAEEQEDIKVHVFDYQDALELLNEGIIDNAASVISLQWLALNKSKVDKQIEG